MKYFFIFFLFVTTSCSHKIFERLSKEIDRTRDYKYYQIYTPFFHDYRMSLKKNGELKFINWEKDTILILETFVAESSPTMVGTIWNAKGIIEYNFVGKERIMPPQIFFVDSNLIKYLKNENAKIVEYYKSLPEHTVKNGYFFEKVVITKGAFLILERKHFLY